MTLKTDNTELFHNYGIYIPRRTIEIIGEFDSTMFCEVWRNLHILDHTSGDINIIINSEGGCTYVAQAIFDLIRGCNNDVRGMVYGGASSSASIVLQACDIRCMSPNSYIMLHLGEESSPAMHPTIKARWDKKNQHLTNWMENTYLKQIKKKKPRYTRAQLQSLLKFDTILEAKEAIEMGLADRIEEHYE